MAKIADNTTVCVEIFRSEMEQRNFVNSSNLISPYGIPEIKYIRK